MGFIKKKKKKKVNKTGNANYLNSNYSFIKKIKEK